MAAKDSAHDLGLLLDLEAREQQAGSSLPAEPSLSAEPSLAQAYSSDGDDTPSRSGAAAPATGLGAPCHQRSD